MKSFRYFLWSLVVIFAAISGYVALNAVSSVDKTRFGGEFALVRNDGKPITDKDLMGRPHLIFFGFTHCPEICPTTLYETSGWLDALGPDASKLDAYFVTIDPERDTVEVLSSYLSSFKDRIIGMTGSLEEIDRIAKAYHVYYKKVPLEGADYTMDHTAQVFLIRADGSFQGTIAFQENPDIAMEKIKRLLDG